MWFVLAIVVCFAFGIMGTSFTLVSAVVSRHYRWEYFAALLRQDASFFFEEGNAPGSLVAQLTSHTQQLQDLVSNSLGLILVVVVNLVASCALSLAETWKLGLVAITGSLPVIILAGHLRIRLESTHHSRIEQSFNESARFVAEAVGALKTISSLNLERVTYEKFAEKSKIPVIKEYRSAPVKMALFAFSQSAAILG